MEISKISAIDTFLDYFRPKIIKTVIKPTQNAINFIVYTYNHKGKLEIAEVRPHKIDERA
jgi:hypothetical protein